MDLRGGADWRRAQHFRVARHDADVPAGPRDAAAWQAARERLLGGTAPPLEALARERGAAAASGAASSSGEPGAAEERRALRAAQEECFRYARSVLSTTATTLDPMSFTRLVCGRPVQVPPMSVVSKPRPPPIRTPGPFVPSSEPPAPSHHPPQLRPKVVLPADFVARLLVFPLTHGPPAPGQEQRSARAGQPGPLWSTWRGPVTGEPGAACPESSAPA